MSGFESERTPLKGSLLQLAAMLQSAVDAIVSIDAAGIVESINPATERLFGYSSDELVGQNVKMLMPEPYRGQHDDYIRHYRETGQHKIIGSGREVLGCRKDGSTFPMHLSVSEYEIDGNRHFAGIVHDLSAQRRAETESTRQQTLLQAIINDSPLAIIISDQSHRIFLANPSASRIFGHAPEALIGKDSNILFASHEDCARLRGLRLGFDSLPGEWGAVDPLQVACRRENGQTFPAEITATIIRNRDGNALGTMKLIRDVTQQAKQADALRQAQRMDALGQLTGGIAHDFNNLLTIIIGNNELLLDEGLSAESETLVRRAKEAAEMGARLTGRLLSFSRQRKLDPVVIGLNEHVNAMMDLLGRSLGETIDVSMSLGDQLWKVCVDPSEIENAVLNLAINARDAMPEGGRLIIETGNVSLHADDDLGEFGLPRGDYVCLAVSDTGTGMPSEVVARAFEPFFTTKASGRGTGLGLASIYGFVKQSGGNATIYSELGHGTTIRLYLPKVHPDPVAAGLVAIKENLGLVCETVLVVEDNPELRQLSLDRLMRLGYRVVAADSGRSALALLEAETKIDLIFSDVVMPGRISGYELARLAVERFPMIKILLTSGYGGEFSAPENTSDTRYKVLSKPYKQTDLARALRQALLS
ncbi:PAS domain S-box protein [Hyphomicrobium sp.]|jgi:PAS domain S-box-containing protein|uniref:hybrid sensor histidine kinase/response regulator n=1 Tax=Hyphomicrobium sp. TaxID=82 RepID=UPI003564F87B